MAFAYAPPTGGRVYWQFHPFGTQPANAQKITDLLIAGTNWAAGRE